MVLCVIETLQFHLNRDAQHASGGLHLGHDEGGQEAQNEEHDHRAEGLADGIDCGIALKR